MGATSSHLPAKSFPLNPQRQSGHLIRAGHPDKGQKKTRQSGKIGDRRDVFRYFSADGSLWAGGPPFPPCNVPLHTRGAPLFARSAPLFLALAPKGGFTMLSTYKLPGAKYHS